MWSQIFLWNVHVLNILDLLSRPFRAHVLFLWDKCPGVELLEYVIIAHFCYCLLACLLSLAFRTVLIFTLRCSDRCVMISHYDFNFFICLFAICVSSSMKCLFVFFAYFIIRPFIFTVAFESFCTFIYYLSWICGLQIFPSSAHFVI